MGKMVVTILAAVAEVERRGIMERTNEGRLEAVQKGVIFGRKKSVNREKIIQLRKSGISAQEISKKLKIGRSTVYKIISSNNG